MKILTAAQLKEADQATLKSQKISSAELMERVSLIVFQKIHERLSGAPVPIKIFCGIGNNGGDGLAIARHLLQHGYHVKVYITNCSTNRSKNFLINYDLIKEVSNDWPTLLDCKDDLPAIDKGDIVIDAIFGTGLSKSVQGWLGTLVEKINGSGAFVISIDMPSGLYANKQQPKKGKIIKANHTFTFNNPKLSFFMKDTGHYAGTYEVLDIGLDPGYVSNAIPVAIVITSESAQNIYRPRKKFTHKGDYGHVLVVAGSKGKMGAASLAAMASINSGAGKVTAYIPSSGNLIVQTLAPEVMTLSDQGTNFLEKFEMELEDEVLCVGPGMGTNDTTVALDC